ARQTRQRQGRRALRALCLWRRARQCLCRIDRRRRAAYALRACDGREGTHPRRALPDRRGFPRRPRGDAAGEWHRPRLRSPGDAGDGRGTHRPGDLDAGGRVMKTLRTPEELHDAGLIAPERAAALADVAARYAVAIPPALAALIDRNDPNDPIARQFVPDVAELDVQRQENADPIGDAAHSPVEGIVHRYPDRVLFKLTHVCAVYCRFCFRREMVGPNHPNALSAEARARALAYIAAHPEIWEVILTGGDPLVASARR